MSDSDSQSGLATRAYRTVSPWYEGRDDVEMNAIGWAMFLGVVVVMVPLLPFLVLVWLITKAFDALAPRDGSGS